MGRRYAKPINPFRITVFISRTVTADVTPQSGVRAQSEKSGVLHCGQLRTLFRSFSFSLNIFGSTRGSARHSKHQTTMKPLKQMRKSTLFRVGVVYALLALFERTRCSRRRKWLCTRNSAQWQGTRSLESTCALEQGKRQQKEQQQQQASVWIRVMLLLLLLLLLC